jgi:hypothetical protein
MDPSVNTGASDELTRVFVSYAREDRKWLDRDYRFNLIPFLMESLRKQNVVFWFDKDLKPGDEFRNHIEAEIDQAQIALLIVSQAFLNSEFIDKYEMSRIADRARLGQMIIVPVLVEPCDWSEYPVLADRQMVPGAMPLIDFTESDSKWARVKADILDGLKTQIKRIRAPQAPAQSVGNQKNIPRESAQFQAGPVFAATPVQPRPIPNPADFRPDLPKMEEPKSGLRSVPIWVWAGAAVLVLAAVFGVGRPAGPHPQPEPSTSLPVQPSSTPDTNLRPPNSLPAAPHAPVPRANPQISPQSSNNAAKKQQADTFFDQNRYAQSAPLYEELCLGGGGPSCNRIGYQYQNGMGVTQDASRAANFYSRACTLNFPNGCSNLGNLYRQGLGVPKNLVLARQLLTKGCSMGNQFGCDKLKLMQ